MFSTIFDLITILLQTGLATPQTIALPVKPENCTAGSVGTNLNRLNHVATAEHLTFCLERYIYSP